MFSLLMKLVLRDSFHSQFLGNVLLALGRMIHNIHRHSLNWGRICGFSRGSNCGELSLKQMTLVIWGLKIFTASSIRVKTPRALNLNNGWLWFYACTNKFASLTPKYYLHRFEKEEQDKKKMQNRSEIPKIAHFTVRIGAHEDSRDFTKKLAWGLQSGFSPLRPIRLELRGDESEFEHWWGRGQWANGLHPVVVDRDHESVRVKSSRASHLGSLVLDLGLGSTSIFRRRKLKLLLRTVADENGKVGGDIEMDSRDGDLQREEDGGIRMMKRREEKKETEVWGF